jgi:hypothetical protein
MTTSPDGTYATGDSVGIVAVMSKPIADGAQITVTLDTGETVLLTKTGPYTMSGTYVIGADVSSSDLTVTSYALTSAPADVDGITMTSLTVPTSTNNIAGASAIVIGEAVNMPVSTGSGPIIECEPQDPAVGATVTCTITGADPGAEILWQAYAGDAVHAGGPVRIGPDGSGILRFTVLRSALGQQVSVELVEWVRPIRLGIVGGPVPASVPAGDGRGLPHFAIVIACVAAVLIGSRRWAAHAIPPA